MGLFNTSDLTLDREDIKDLSEAILSKYYEKPGIGDFHTLIKGIKHEKQLAIIGLFEGLSGKAKTTCGMTPNDGQIRSIDKTWTPKRIGDRFDQCADDLIETFFVWGLKPGVNKEDLGGTEFAVFLEERIADVMMDGVFRHAWFGDTAAANYNSSPAGVIKNGTDLGYFNVIDGLFKQMFAIVAADNTRKTTGPTENLATKNAKSTYALQRFNDTDTSNQLVTKVLDTMVTDADERLTSGSETPIFLVTKSVADQYKRERKFAFPSIDMAYERIENGILTLKSDGYTLIVFSFWDRMINQYFNDGTKWYLPHRIVFAAKSNVLIGTEEEKTLTELKAYYTEDTEKFTWKYAYNLDAKFGDDDLLQFAY
jgi:hypothetical protein